MCDAITPVTCEACTAAWDCNWCPDVARCVSGDIFGGACVDRSWQWRQCVFAGWVLLLLACLGIAIVLAVALLCCCCCCKCRRRRREAQEARRYRDLENEKRQAKAVPHQSRLRAAIATNSPQPEAAAPPPKQRSFFARLLNPDAPEAAGAAAAATESTPLHRSTVVRTAEETNPFSLSRVGGRGRDCGGLKVEESVARRPDGPHGDHNHTAFDHPCVGPALLGSVLVTCVLLASVIVVAYCCRLGGVARRRKKRGISDDEAAHDYEEFWFSRLETAGLAVLTIAAIPVFIEYVRHPEGNVYWLLSSSCDVAGMMCVCAAFIWEDSRWEVPLGACGSVILLASDIFAAYSAAIIGLSSTSLGVVLLWFSSSIVSAAGCVFLLLCYFSFPCGERLRLYFEMACLALFSLSAMIEIGFGFCPAEKSSPNFFGSAGIMNLLGYVCCVGALMSENWPRQPLKLSCTMPPQTDDSEIDEEGNEKLLAM